MYDFAFKSVTTSKSSCIEILTHTIPSSTNSSPLTLLTLLTLNPQSPKMAFVNATPIASRSFLASKKAPRVTVSSRNPVRMVAAETKTTTKLSNRATQLLSYVRAHKSIFRPGVGFNSTHATLFRKNDTGRSFTPLDELATNAHTLPAGSVAATMVVQAQDIIDKCYASAVSQFPALEQDDVLNEIFHHDIRYILRVISYGAACQSSDFIHENNMGMLKLLHEEVGFPAGLVADAVRVARDEVLNQVNDASIVEGTTNCFDAVSTFMS